jgi:acetyl-CoA carboxylase biotin carboxyl carrier protein
VSDPQNRRRANPSNGEGPSVDLAAIDHLADDLLPALIAKLSATNLGEIEIREGHWKLRLRRPALSAASLSKRQADRAASRAQPGHAGHGHAPGALDVHRAATPTPAATASSNGQAGPGLPVGPGRSAEGRTDGSDDRSVATSPAVGVFQPASGAEAGAKVRSGDRLGVVEVLGVPHEVLAPADGVIGETLVEAGHAVEYGQDLVRLELAATEAAG